MELHEMTVSQVIQHSRKVSPGTELVHLKYWAIAVVKNCNEPLGLEHGCGFYKHKRSACKRFIDRFEITEEELK